MSTRRVLVVLSLGFMAFGSAVSAQCPNTPPGPAGEGDVTWETAVTCGASNQSTCKGFTVDCSGADAPDGDATGDVRITDPSGTALGTILFLTGGRSADYYADTGGFGTEAADALDNLVTDGYRTVEIKFDQSNTWSTADNGEVDGYLNLACRAATLFKEIYDTTHGGSSGGSFCGTGNSGGGATLAYAISHYTLESIFDAVLFTAGPPMSRVDWGCLGHTPGNFEYDCGNKVQTDQSFGNFTNLSGPPDCDDTPPADAHCVKETSACEDAFEATSIISDEYTPDYTFPNLTIGFRFGANDTTSAVDQGEEYCEELETANSLDLDCDVRTTGVGHGYPSYSAGADEVENFLDDC